MSNSNSPPQPTANRQPSEVQPAHHFLLRHSIPPHRKKPPHCRATSPLRAKATQDNPGKYFLSENMAKTKSTKTSSTETKSSETSSTKVDRSKGQKKRGWNEIDSIFSTKAKASKKQQPQNSARGSKSQFHPSLPKTSKGQWVNDGLGGVYNSEGFTGRIEDGVRIFKGHVLDQDPKAGTTKDCPFDCKCCVI